jgi:ribosome-associated protein
VTSQELAQEISQAAQDVKAEDVMTLDLRGLVSFTDFFVIASGRSDRQVQAVADRIIENLGKKKIKATGIEGYETGHWILLDFGSVVAHIFYPETREFYALEKLWSDAPRCDDDKEAGREVAP